MNPEVLVLGHKGMLGSDLSRRFSAEAEVITADLPELDITDFDAVQKILFAEKPAHIFNCAAFTAVDACEKQEAQAIKVNAEAVKHLALTSNEIDAHLWHFSTDYIFNGRTSKPYEEDAPPDPINAYGRSKLAGEQHLQIHAVRYTLIRSQWLYGLGGKNFVETILRLGAEKGELRIVNDQIGSPTYTKDLVEGVVELWRRGAQGIYHITNQGKCSWFDFGKAILESVGLSPAKVTPVSSEEFGAAAPRPGFSVLDCSKFYRETGKALRFWQEALADYMKARGDN